MNKIINTIIYGIIILTFLGCTSEEVKQELKLNEMKERGEQQKSEPEIKLVSCTLNRTDGECQNFSNDTQTCSKGECREGDCKEGKGKLEFQGGSYYEGLFKKGNYNGVGLLVVCDNSKYDGTFKDGYLEKGVFTDTEGSTYTGSLKNNLFEGKGKLVTSSGDVYDGFWKKGKKNGKFIVIVSEEKSSITFQDDEDIIEISRRKKEEAEEKRRNALSAMWSEHQGRAEYDSAYEQCKSIGMRLPSIDELKAAYRNGVVSSWDDDVYWSSTPYNRKLVYKRQHFGNATWYYGLISDGGSTNQYSPSNTWAFRCRR